MLYVVDFSSKPTGNLSAWDVCFQKVSHESAAFLVFRTKEEAESFAPHAGGGATRKPEARGLSKTELQQLQMRASAGDLISKGRAVQFVFRLRDDAAGIVVDHKSVHTLVEE